jgi:hypothetical protein
VADSALRERATRAAVAIAAEHGLAVRDPVVLRDRSNLLLHLRPAPVVARVGTVTGTGRPGTAWLAREVAVAGYLARTGAPVVAPATELPPGPHERDGLAISFWRLVAERDEPVDPAAAGAALRACHELLTGYDGELPPLAGPVEGARVLRAQIAEGVVDGEEAAMLERAAARVQRRMAALAAPLRPIHGDAHLANVLATADGVLWGDWEDTFAGPVEWDLACLHQQAVLFGADPARPAAALAAYGTDADPEAFDACLEARVLQLAAWVLIIVRSHPDRRDRVPPIVGWLQARDG